LLVTSMLILSACGTTAIESTQEASTDSTDAPAATEVVEEPTAEPVEEPALGVEVGQTGFGQDGAEVGYAFIVTNLDDQLIGDSEYQVSVYDANDVVVGTDSGSVVTIGPGQQIGIAGSLFVNDETVEVDRIDVQFRATDRMIFEEEFVFTAENVNYMPDDISPSVSGVVSSSYEQDFGNLVVFAIAYDEADEIIGGGYNFLDFIPAQGQSAIDVSITAAGDPARVELYPLLSILSLE
ncbi:MAG: hypothetical protein AAGF95_28950, partial [Chloroflexota bacterium]